MAYNTGNAIGSTDARDLYDNAQNLDKAMNSTDPTWIDRFGVARPTFKGAESELNQKVGDAEAAAAQARGYLNTMRATSYGPLSEDPTTDPLGNPCTAGDEYFNTTYNLLKRFDGSIWRVPDINTANLASGAGSSMVGHGGQTVEAALNERLLTEDLASSAAGKGAELVGNAIQRVTNVATLRTIAVTTSRDIQTQGYWDKGDGGHGEYYGVTVASAGTYTDNGGSVIVPSGGDGSGAWLLKYRGAISVRQFGAKGDGATSDTAAITAAIGAVKCTVQGGAAGGVNAGATLEFPVGNYKCGALTIDQPVTLKGVGNGQATDASERAKLTFTGTGTFFNFTINAGYCLIEGLSLYGSKAGSLNVDSGTYGNVAVAVGQGVAGTFRDVYFENFDVGFLARTRTGDTWSGAYRNLQGCKFRNNTYSTVLKDLTTQTEFMGCDFRSNDSTGYVYIKTGAGANDYQTAAFTHCVFEHLGGNAFASRGIQIRGTAYVKIMGGYMESCAIWVDAGAQLVGAFYFRPQNGTSLRIGGGGFIDIDKCVAACHPFVLPDLGDAYWSVYNLTANGQDYVGDRLCNKYTVTDATTPQVTSSDFSTYFRLSKQCVPAAPQYLVVQCEFEYYSPANVSVDMFVTAGSNGGTPSTTTPTVSTYTDTTYYDSSAGWKRKSYTLPFASTVGGKPLAWIRPYFLVSGAAVSDVIGIKNMAVKVLAF